MTRSFTRIILGSLLTLAGATMTFAEGDKGDKNIVITRASADLSTHTITIGGVHLLGDNGKKQPTVLLEQKVLPIVGIPTATEIHVQLTFDPSPGTYLLTVSYGPGAGDFSTFDLDIAAPAASLKHRETVKAIPARQVPKARKVTGRGRSCRSSRRERRHRCSRSNRTSGCNRSARSSGTGGCNWSSRPSGTGGCNRCSRPSGSSGCDRSTRSNRANRPSGCDRRDRRNGPCGSACQWAGGYCRRDSLLVCSVLQLSSSSPLWDLVFRAP